jgi:aerobic carbon-monoxide dehydrogenase medium subunit
MKPPDFRYHHPGDSAEAVRLLSELGDEAKVIAGGQSLLPIMNMRLATPGHLVDISGIPKLRQAKASSANARYGSATTHMMFEYDLVPDVTSGLLRHAAAGIGYRAIRTRGTVGGSLAHSDPSAEWPTVMSALDAAVHAVSVRGVRRIPVRELLLGFFSTTLEPDELIIDVEVPRLPERTRWGMYKMARKPGEFAESLAVALVAQDTTGNVREPQIWLGAAAETPMRLTRTEQFVDSQAFDDLTPADIVGPLAADIGNGASAGTDPDGTDPADRHALQLHAVTVHRALLAAKEERRHD